MSPTLDVVFTEIVIRNTRSKHNDTLFASLAVSLDGKAQTSPRVPLGDRNNGQFAVGARVSIQLPPEASHIKYAISVVNAGHTNSANLDQITQALANEVANRATDDSSRQTLLREIIKFVASLLNADCDGPVVTAVHDGNKVDLEILRSLKVGETRRVLAGTDYGSQSAAGCGSNSNYGYGVDVTRTS